MFHTRSPAGTRSRFATAPGRQVVFDALDLGLRLPRDKLTECSPCAATWPWRSGHPSRITSGKPLLSGIHQTEYRPSPAPGCYASRTSRMPRLRSGGSYVGFGGFGDSCLDASSMRASSRFSASANAAASLSIARAVTAL